jgi:hypothetical protein
LLTGWVYSKDLMNQYIFSVEEVDKTMYTENNRSGMPGLGMFLLGVLAGAVAGGIAALLLAPRSGRETREMIRSKAAETGQMIQSRANDVKERVSQVGNAMRSRAQQEAAKADNSE